VAEKFVIYHNPRCRKSREGLQVLRDAGIEPEVVEYLKDPPTKTRVEQLLRLLALEPHDLLRRKEAEYKQAGLSKTSSRAEIAAAIARYPKLLERPVVVRGKRAVLGRPPEKIRELL
jgi:arsenate reductase